MKLTRIVALAAALVVTLSLTACTSSPAPSGSSTPVSQSTDAPASSTPTEQAVGQIYLYGESHGDKELLEAELELWKGYYGNQAMRHLFVEYPYHTAELLNLWLKSDNDDILEQVYSDWAGTASQNPDVKEFLKQIKQKCPETIFHGTDIGHQYDTTGERYLQYLRDNKQQDTEQYKRAQEVMEQGSYYYSNNQDGVYRENKMVENFCYEIDKLSGESVMGIYGAAHTGLAAMDYTTQSVPCMANQLKERYGDVIYSEDLTETVKTYEAERTEVIEVGGKEYQASYFGKQDLTGFKDYASREFWRLEEAYDDFKGNTKSGDMLPDNNYPMPIKTGQVFVIDYTKVDGSVNRMYYRSDGQQLQGAATTEEFVVE